MKTHVVIAGNIGAGKSTLVRMICDQLGWEPYYEPVAENPYLADFYRDMKRWAFNSQVFFLTHRARSHRALMDSRRAVVQDRSCYEDAEVFARAQFLLGSLSARDWETYRRSTRPSRRSLPRLTSSSTCAPRFRRCADASRSAPGDIEADISDEYLQRLNTLYEEWIARFDISPVLVVQGDRLDFVEDSRDLHAIVSTIREHLRGRQGLLFPDEVSGPTELRT